MVSGTETEDLDVGLLVAARSGELDAIATVCGHYRGRLMILASNAGAQQPDVVVQNALTETLLGVEPVDAPSLSEFEHALFQRVVAESDPAANTRTPVEPTPIPPAPTTLEPPAAPIAPSMPTPGFGIGGTGRIAALDLSSDDRPLGAPVPGLVALAAPGTETGVGAVDAGIAGDGALLNPHTGPVDWSVALAAREAPSGPILAPPSRRLMAGAAGVVCGVGLLAALVIFFGGNNSEQADEPQLAAIVPQGGDEASSPDPGSGPEPAAPETSDQNRSSGTVTGSTAASGPSTTATQPDPTTATSLTTVTTSSPPETSASTTSTSSPPSTAPSTTPQSTTTEAPTTTTTRPESTTSTTRPDSTSTTSGPRPGDFSNQSLDNRTFRNGDFRDHDFSGSRLNNVDFRGADLRGVSFAGAVLTNVQFSNVDLTGADFRDADMDSTFFDRSSNISKVDFRRARLINGRISSFFFPGEEPRSWPDGDFQFGN